MRALRLLSAAFALLLAGATPPQTTLYGFTVVSSDRERTQETAFLDTPSAAGALDTAAAIATQPHDAGSPGDYKTAVFMRDQLASFGFDATLETFTARVDVPKALALTLFPTGRTPAIASKDEEAHGIFSRPRKPKATPAPAGASPTPEPVPAVVIDLREPPIPSDADTANPAIGLPFLAGSADGDVAAPLVYAGFGSDADYDRLSDHGISVRGAIAIVRNGREFRGITARRAQARGIVGVLFYDDPAEDGPGRGAAYPNGPYRPLTSVRRGTVGEGVTIPVLPISAANAQTLIAALRGPATAPPPWTGALAVRYPFARGPATARLSVQLSRKTTTLWNTIGVLTGARQPAATIVLGAHRDAWVFGAGDNGSGIETLIEAARGLGFLAKGGWRPARSIVVAGWDGEERGAGGTIAFVKQHAEDLRLGGVAYLDAEQTVTGSRFGTDVVAAIAPTVADATRMVPDPAQPGTTIYDRWAFRSRVLPQRRLIDAAGDRPTSLFDLGIPSANAGFSGILGPEHSSYDTVTFATTYSDPGFELHRTAAQLYGVIAMRLADADAVPYQFSAYTPLLQSAARSVAAAAKAAKRHLDTAGLGKSIARFGAAARRFDAGTARVATGPAADRALEAVRVVDVAAYGSDGNGNVTLPDIAHAIGGGDQAEIDRAVARVRTALERAGSLLAF
jgi:N-acetylated-alpha-linked acidic dipeptidase